MKSLTIVALLAAPTAAVHPALAADLAESRAQQTGAFAGFRVRLPLDGAAPGRRMRAGLTLAPTLHSRTLQGESQLRFGEGIELGLRGNEPVRLSLAGTPVSQLAQGPAGPDGRRMGVSTLGWIAIGVGVVAAGVFALGQLCADGEICGSDRDD